MTSNASSYLYIKTQPQSKLPPASPSSNEDVSEKNVMTCLDEIPSITMRRCAGSQTLINDRFDNLLNLLNLDLPHAPAIHGRPLEKTY